jgi:hypothetical protein
MWYARMSQPNRADMKRCCWPSGESWQDITVADVDDLPWTPECKTQHPQMNKLFLEFDLGK